MVIQDGLEPSTLYLKGRYSTTELLDHYFVSVKFYQLIKLVIFCQYFFLNKLIYFSSLKFNIIYFIDILDFNPNGAVEL